MQQEDLFMPQNLSANKLLANMDPDAVYGETKVIIKHEDVVLHSLNELWVREEVFEPQFTNKLDPFFTDIMLRPSTIKGKMTECIAFNIETYCQGESNGMKGVSRVVLANERGERILDTQIKFVNPSMSLRK